MRKNWRNGGESLLKNGTIDFIYLFIYLFISFAPTYNFTQISNNQIKNRITIVAILKEKTHNVLVQKGKAAKRITLYHASSQGCIAGVINIMHGCYTSKKARKKATQFAIFTEQKKRYLQTNLHSHMQTIHSHHYSTVTFSYTFSSVTQSVPLLSSCLRSHTYSHT